MVSVIQLTGAAATQRLSIKNTESMPITVEMQAFGMTVDEAGKRQLTEETNDLLLFPPQSVIPPGREQVVQVRYAAQSKATAPKMYLIRVSQLPISLSSKDSQTLQANVLMAFTINTHLFVQPPGAKAALEVGSPTRQANGDLVFQIRNTGNGIAQLRNAKYLLRLGAAQPAAVDAKEVVLGEISALPPGATRLARIPAKLAGGGGDASVAVELL